MFPRVILCYDTIPLHPSTMVAGCFKSKGLRLSSLLEFSEHRIWQLLGALETVLNEQTAYPIHLFFQNQTSLVTGDCEDATPAFPLPGTPSLQQTAASQGG